MKILVTGAAGFIGAALCRVLLDRGDRVVGIDDLNTYYDVKLKKARLEGLTSFTTFLFQKLDFALPVIILHNTSCLFFFIFPIFRS